MFCNTISIRSIVKVNYLKKKSPKFFWCALVPPSGRPQKFFQEGKNDVLLVSFRLLTMQRKLTYAKRLPFLRH